MAVQTSDRKWFLLELFYGRYKPRQAAFENRDRKVRCFTLITLTFFADFIQEEKNYLVRTCLRKMGIDQNLCRGEIVKTTGYVLGKSYGLFTLEEICGIILLITA